MASGWTKGALWLEGNRYSKVTYFDGTPMMSDGYFTFSRDSGNTSCIIMCLVQLWAYAYAFATCVANSDYVV